MTNDQVLGYVKQQLSIGVGRDVITTNLKGAGWSDADINEVFSALIPVATTPTPAPSAVPPVGVPNMIRPQPVMPTMQTVNPIPPIHKSKKMLSVIIILILLGLAGGAAAYAYYTGAFVTLPDLLKGYTTRSQDLKSFKADLNLSVDFSGVKSITDQLRSMPLLGVNSPTQINFGVLASYDTSDKNNMKISSVISINAGSLSLEAQLRMLDGNLYAELTKVPALSILPLSMLEMYKNKWFSSPYKSSLIDQDFTSKFTPAERDYLEKILQDSSVIKTVARLPSETIAGELSYHFSFDLDKEAFVAYMQSYKNYVESLGKSDPQISAFDLTSFRKILDQVKDFKGEIWIGRNDKLFHKVTVSFGVQPDITKDEQVKVNISGIASDYNKPVLITAPAESTPFQTLISSMMPAPAPATSAVKKK